MTSPVVAPAEPARQTTVRSTRPAHGASESTVQRDVIDAAPRTGATDLLRLVPGLVASQHSGEGKAQQLFLRGFDAVHGQDVELNVAGLPVNEVSHIHALGYADLNWLIPSVVREVRVTEGSGRAWQGDFAVAGTVRYELGLDEPGFTAAFSHASFNRTRLFAGFRPDVSKLGDNTFVAAEYVEGDGFGPRRDFHRFSAIGQLQLKLEALTLRALATTYNTAYSSPGVLRDDAWRSGKVGFFDVSGSWQGGIVSRHQVLVGADLSLDGSKTTLEAYGLLIDTKLRNNFTGFLANPVGDGLEQKQNANTIGARLMHTRHLHVGDQVLALELGVGLRRDGVAQGQRGYDDATGALREPLFGGAATPFREAVDVSFVQSMASAWGEVAWAPGAWRFMLGGRFDFLGIELDDHLAFSGIGTHRTSFGPHFGLKAGVERGFGEHVRLFASYGDGFRTPQARQLSDGEKAPFIDVRGAELGLRIESERFAASGAAFGSFVANDFFFDHTVGTTSYVGNTIRGGGQFGVTAHPVDGFLISANFTVAHAQLTQKQALLPYFAPLVGRIDSSWTRPFELGGRTVKPFVGVGMTFIGPRPLPDDERSHAIFLVDARLGLRTGPVELSLDIQNALDSLWRDGEFLYASKWDQAATASRLASRQFTAGAPRTFTVTLELHL
ncbi:MAG: TonB-dependent receptor [Archangium sp.]|nr:TonB-dependent receptor [Archangium sp.]